MEEKKREVHKYSSPITFVVLFHLSFLPLLIFITHVYWRETEEGKKREGIDFFSLIPCWNSFWTQEVYAIVFWYTDEFPAESIVRESWKWLIIKTENWNPRERLELEDLLTGVEVAAQGAVVWIEHSDSVRKDSAFRNKFL